MTLLYHEDMLKLLAAHRKARYVKQEQLRKQQQANQRENIASLLEGNRKGSNQNYQAVVHGHRPSKRDQVRQRTVQQLSRDGAKAYWLKAIAEGY